MTPLHERQFADFVRESGDSLLRFARFVAPDAQEAEDLLQVALMRLAKHWTRPIEAPVAYVRSPLVNLVVDGTRRSHLVPVPVESETEVHCVLGSHEEAVVAQARLDYALAQLPHRQRITVALRVLEGLSETETAAIMACSQGTVKSNLSRGLDKLRAHFESESVSEGSTS